jgi:mannose-6-phosphate isomerase-like protein (cupin superfamily)
MRTKGRGRRAPTDPEHRTYNSELKGGKTTPLQPYNVDDMENKETDHRPWGYYEVLKDEPFCKVKKIVVYPGKRLSLQRHRRRSEHWFVVQGQASVTLDDAVLHIAAGQAVDIPRETKHRVANTAGEDLAFIEIQTGDYFGEDDIERLEDDFGRA